LYYRKLFSYSRSCNCKLLFNTHRPLEKPVPAGGPLGLGAVAVLAPWLAPYFNRLKTSVAEVHPHVFEQVVGMWLRDVTQHELPAGADVEGCGGLLDLLRGGRVVERGHQTGNPRGGRAKTQWLRSAGRRWGGPNTRSAGGDQGTPPWAGRRVGGGGARPGAPPAAGVGGTPGGRNSGGGGRSGVV